MVAVQPRDADRLAAAPPENIRLFLIYGSDAGAITERARRIEALALKRGGGDEVLRLGSDELSANPGRIADEAYAISMFGGEPVISLRVLDGRHNVVGALEALFDRPPEAAWVIVEAGELSPTSPLRKAFEAAHHAAALPTYGLEGGALTTFIHAAVEEAGLTIEGDALELLATGLAGDRLATRSELDKLVLYVGDRKEITVVDIEAVVGDTTEAETDRIIDAALLGNHEELDSGLERLRAEGGSPASLATLALRHLIHLQSLRLALDSGERLDAVLRGARPPVHYRRRTATEASVKRWTQDALVEARRLADGAVYLSRMQPNLEYAAVSDAMHKIALTARQLKRGG
jgi:DNA polymerase-3 subunit delta